MTNEQILEKLKGHTIYMVQMFLVAMLNPKSVSVEFDSWYDQFEEAEDIANIFGLDIEELIELNILFFDPEGFVDYLQKHGRYGFITELHIPVKYNFKDDGSYYTSKKMRSKSVYADTFEELIDKAIEVEKKYEQIDRGIEEDRVK